MEEEKKSLLERLRALIFGESDKKRAEQKARSDEFTDFLTEHQEEEEERAAGRKKPA